MKGLLVLLFLWGSFSDPYDRLVTGDHPVLYWNDASGGDVMASRRNGVLTNGPGSAAMPDGDVGIDFNGVDQYMEVSSGGLGAGSYFQALANDPVVVGEWIHYVLIINTTDAAGSAPFRMGTRDLGSFFKGAIGKIAIYNYELGAGQVESHARRMLR
jgi:hypothetical protein